jgi:hypothetical protein
MDEFKAFGSIARYSREVVVTEKIDGTNGQIYVKDDGTIQAGSRNRWIEPGDDNYGFAKWVHQNHEELLKLGPGRHYGEWWGKGIQRGYGISEKRFSLFNTSKWNNETCPACCEVVPVLWTGSMDKLDVPSIMADLATTGSWASLTYMNPEGIVIYHTAGNFYLKKTFEKDEAGKGGRL